MLRFKRYKNHGLRSCACARCETDAVVRNGLAYTPAQMEKLTARGMPVNNLSTQSLYIDGEPNPPFHVGAERTRFVDVCDLWEQHMDLCDRARKAALSKSKSKNPD